MTETATECGMLTVPQIASELNVQPATVTSWIRSGQLPAVLVNKSPRCARQRFRVRREDLDAFIAGRRVEAAPATRRKRRAAFERIV